MTVPLVSLPDLQTNITEKMWPVELERRGGVLMSASNANLGNSLIGLLQFTVTKATISNLWRQVILNRLPAAARQVWLGSICVYAVELERDSSNHEQVSQLTLNCHLFFLCPTTSYVHIMVISTHVKTTGIARYLCIYKYPRTSTGG
jgi:hypothetical protein